MKRIATLYLIALLVVGAIVAANTLTATDGIVLAGIALLALYIALPFAILYGIVKFVKFAWKH
jgi:hypothetical protein